MGRRPSNHRLAEVSASVRASDNARLARHATAPADDVGYDNRAARRAAARAARNTVVSTVDNEENQEE